MQYADTRFSDFAMRIKEVQCSYTNPQNDVTYYNMVNQHKIQNFQLYNKVALPLSFTTLIIVFICNLLHLPKSDQALMTLLIKVLNFMSHFMLALKLQKEVYYNVPEAVENILINN